MFMSRRSRTQDPILSLRSLLFPHCSIPLCNNGRRLYRSAVVSSRVRRSAPTEGPNPRTAPCPRCMYWCWCFGPVDGIQATEAFHKLQPASIREELGGLGYMVRESLSRVSRARGDGGENEALLPRNKPVNMRESAKESPANNFPSDAPVTCPHTITRGLSSPSWTGLLYMRARERSSLTSMTSHASMVFAST